jgi:MoxR-like ATPase
VAQRLVAQPRAQLCGGAREVNSPVAGCGTELDPILINTADDLISMDDPDISMAGLHFLQTSNIDISTYNDWPSFQFNGYYHGNHKIIHSNRTHTNNSSTSAVYIFEKTIGSKIIENLTLEKCGIAKTADASWIVNCKTKNSNLVENAINKTKVESCRARNGRIIGYRANSATITRCQVIDELPGIAITATNTVISDCSVVYSLSTNRDNDSLIVEHIDNKSIVERCFGAGKLVKNENITEPTGHIINKSSNSMITNSALGKLEYSKDTQFLGMRTTFNFRSSQKNRIVGTIDVNSKLINNAALDTTPGQDDANGFDGKSIAEARFSQRFFEATLGWDFVNVWQWDATNNRPALHFDKAAIQGTTASTSGSESAETKMIDMLTSQVRTNIWI